MTLRPSSAPPGCPAHTQASHRADALGMPPTAAASPPLMHPAGSWPPGPPSGLTGWGLLRQMSRDLIGTASVWQAQYGDVVHLRIWPEHQVLVMDPALVRDLLVTHHDALIRWERGVQVFAQLHGRSVLVSEGAAWRAKRQALQPAFAPKPVQAFVPTIAETARRALADWPAASASWPIEQAFTSLAMAVILRNLFSGDMDELGDEARAAEQAVRTVTELADAEFYWPASWPAAMPWKRRKREALATLNRLIDRQLQARLAMAVAARPDDLLSRLLALHDGDAAAWPLRAVRDECMTAFLAGHETVASSLTWWAWCMAAHPQAQAAAAEAVRQQLQGRLPGVDDLPALGALTQTLHEAMRQYPAAPVLMTRRCTRPITLGPWQLPARTLFMVPLQLMQRDPRWFAEPELFRPERFGPQAPALPRGAWMPFGAGPRVCLGQHLAMAEMTVVAAMVLQRVVLSVPEGQGAPTPVLHVTLRPNTPLNLRLSPAIHGVNTH
ncbi:MAG: hypothetical protein RJA98_2767 [Pseudomonadota bacterium]